MAGFGDLEFMQRGRRFAIGIVMLGLGGVIGYALPKSDATPKAETGTIASVDNATQNAGIRFSITLKKVAKPESFRWQDATPWRDKAGHWHSKGTPDVPGACRDDPRDAGQGNRRRRRCGGGQLGLRSHDRRLGQVLPLTRQAGRAGHGSRIDTVNG